MIGGRLKECFQTAFLSIQTEIPVLPPFCHFAVWILSAREWRHRYVSSECTAFDWTLRFPSSGEARLRCGTVLPQCAASVCRAAVRFPIGLRRGGVVGRGLNEEGAFLCRQFARGFCGGAGVEEAAFQAFARRH